MHGQRGHKDIWKQIGRNASPNVPSPMTVYAGGIWGKLQKLSRFFSEKALFFAQVAEKGTGLDHCSHPWGNCLYPWIKPHPCEEQSCIRLLQDKSLKSGAAILPHPESSIWKSWQHNLQTLSLEVGGWRGMRKRSHMGNCLPWFLIATAQVEAADAAHFQYDPTLA